VILIVPLIAGGLFGALCIVLIRFRRRRGTKRVTWAQIIDGGMIDEVLNANELMRTFFVADSINPADFLANYVEVSGSSPVKPPVEPGKPTRSAVAFEKGAKIPPGYPRWFLAAYPDVVLWLSTQDENAMLRIAAEALYGAEGARELIRIHGLTRIKELIDEKFEAFDISQLRRLVRTFGKDTRKRLECAMVVKEKRQRRRWFESKPKRPMDHLSKRVISDLDF
jgi:hypothetical protein